MNLLIVKIISIILLSSPFCWANNFSPLAPSTSTLLNEILDPLENIFSHIYDSASLINEEGQSLVFSYPSCGQLKISWDSVISFNQITDTLIIKCANEVKRIQQIRRGKNLKAFTIIDWFTYNSRNVTKYDFYSLDLLWEPFYLEYQKSSQKQQLYLIAKFYQYDSPFQFEFSEELFNEPARRYEIITPQPRAFVLWNTEGHFFISTRNHPLTPREFTANLNFPLHLLGRSLGWFLPQKSTSQSSH